MFLLSEETSFQIETKKGMPVVAPGAPAWVFFQSSVHTPITRIGLVVLSGASALFEPFDVIGDERGLLTVGQALPQISADGLVANLFFRHGDSNIPLASVSLPSVCGKDPWVEIAFSLTEVAGKKGSLVVECDPGPARDSTADWLAVYECVVGKPADFNLNRARAFRNWRSRNELQHMGQSYNDGDFYTSGISQSVYQRLSAQEQTAGLRNLNANAFEIVQLLVQTRLGWSSFQFHQLLAEKAHAASQPLRVLSLCSGAARVEADLIFRSGIRNIQLTLVDLNPQLLENARAKLSRLCDCGVIAADANEFEIEPQGYDLILCVSGLHHLVELERVSRSMAGGLAPGGEFWSIGEYVGRNGARLWPEAYAVANKFFQQLPEHFRRNWAPGVDGKIDSALRDIDCSVSTFESIRSEDLEDCLNQVFKPFQLARHDCLLWYLFDASYARNYDLREDAVWDILQRAAELEVAHYLNGGRPTGLNAVYRKR